MLAHIPNFLTLCNLACGCYGVVAVFRGDTNMGSMMIWAGALFDFFDGFAARMLKKYSSIGKDLDSLADIVTFCFLPATLLFVLIGHNSENMILPYFGFLLVIFGALRLAKFNNDTRQGEFFYGLPVPAAGIFVSGLPYLAAIEYDAVASIISNQYFLIGIAILLSALMVSDIKLMSLKSTDFSFKGNWQRYLLLLSSVVLLLLWQFAALPVIISLYLVLSMALNIGD